MSFPRLRKSSSYAKVKHIYDQVQDGVFYSKQVGLTHTDTSLLKNNGYIINVKGIKEKHMTTAITSSNDTSYRVKLYKLSSRAVEIIEEDMEKERLLKEQQEKEEKEKN